MGDRDRIISSSVPNDRHPVDSAELEKPSQQWPALTPLSDRVSAPFAILIFVCLITVVQVLISSTYRELLVFLWSGAILTIRISVVAFIIAFPFGLVAGLGRVSQSWLFHSLATLYVEIVRGIPVLVQLLYIGFVVTPAIARWLGVRNIDEATRAIVALAFSNGAYLAEIFRAGVQAISRGQVEAALSIGLSRIQIIRLVILPQAISIILPPLGNDFISVLKNSSLASVLSARELSQLGRTSVSRSFDTFTTWNMVALLYLIMTLVLSLAVRKLERRMPVR